MDERLEKIFEELKPILNKMDLFEVLGLACMIIWKIMKETRISREKIIETINYALEAQEEIEKSEEE